METVCGNNTGGSVRSYSKPGNCLGIYYENVRGLRTKQLKLYENVFSVDYDIIRLTEVWLNDLYCDHDLFPEYYTAVCSDWESVNDTHDGSVLIALSSRVHSYKCHYCLESCDECTWVEIPTSDCPPVFIDYYFPPDTIPDVITNYFCFLENKLDTHNFLVIIVGDFNSPGFDWKCGLPQPNCHSYSKLKGDAIFTSTYILNLTQCLDTDGRSNLLDLIFSNLSDLCITPVDPGLIKPEYFHPPLNIKIHLPAAICTQNYVYSYRNYKSGHYVCSTIFFQLMIGVVCMVPPVLIPLLPASVLLFMVQLSRQFLAS
jgi:hypothetical protein